MTQDVELEPTVVKPVVDKTRHDAQKNEDAVSWISALGFSWMSSIASLATERQLRIEDVYDNNKSLTQEQTWIEFKPYYDAAVKAKDLRLAQEAEKTKTTVKDKEEEDEEDLINKRVKVVNVLPEIGLGGAFWRAYRLQYLVSAFLFAVATLSELATPIVLKRFLVFLEETQPDINGDIIYDFNQGLNYVLLLFGLSIFRSFAANHSFVIVLKILIKVRSIIIRLVYEKSLKIPVQSRQLITSGGIINLLSNDSQLLDYARSMQYWWASFPILAVGFYLIFQEIGGAAWALIICFVCFLPLAFFLIRRMFKKRTLYLFNADKRIGNSNEIVQSMKILKFYSWEKSFMETNESLRDNELENVAGFTYTRHATISLLLSIPFFSGVIMMIIYADQNPDGMQASVIFSLLALVNMIRNPFSFLPSSISNIISMNVSFKRISRLLSLKDCTFENLEVDEKNNDEEYITFDNVKIGWDLYDPIIPHKKGKKGKKGKKEEANNSDLKVVEADNDDGKDIEIGIADNDDEKDIEIGITDKKEGSKDEGGAKDEEDKQDDDEDKQDDEDSQKKSKDEKKKLAKAKKDKEKLLAKINKFTPRTTVILEKADFTIKKGDLTVVIGPTGSGKSSLVKTLIGETKIMQGKVILPTKTFTYVPQEPFIMNTTIKENILFGSEYDEERYLQVLEACSLVEDLSVLKGADLIEVGSAGHNLSGGQKQRLAMARACYNMDKSDICCLDDPFSALDKDVGEEIMNNCVNGVLKHKTRILVTHALQYVHLADQIIVIGETEEGSNSYTVKETGTYKELMENEAGTLSLLISEHMAAYKAEQEKKQKEEEAEHDIDNVLVKKGILKKEEEHKEVENTTSKLRSILKKGKHVKLTTKEEMNVGKVSWDTWKILWTASGGRVFKFSLILILLIPQISFAISQFWLARWANDPNSTGLVDYYIKWYSIIVGIYMVTNVMKSVASARFGLNVGRNVFKKLMSFLMRKNMSFYDANPPGRIINRLTKDIGAVDSFLSMNFEFTIMMLLSIITICVMMIIIVPWTAVAIVILTYGYYKLQEYYRNSARDLTRLESVNRTPLFSHLNETLSGISSIRAFGKGNDYADKNNHITDTHKKVLSIQYFINYWLRIRLEVVIGSTILVVSALFALLFNISSGQAGVMITWGINLTALLNFVVVQTSYFEAKMNAIERMDYYSNDDQTEALDLTEKKTESEWPKEGKIHFKNVSFKYREDLPIVLKDFNLEIEAGTKVGIVGRTGSGKSTIFNALLRLYECEQESKIEIDGDNIFDMDLQKLRKNIIIIPQDPVLFNQSLRYNIDPHRDFTDEQILEVIREVKLDGLVEHKFKDGLLEPIHEGGANLSLGQRQLLCLARALIRKPKLLLIDEASASIDVKSDELLQHVIKTKFEGITILTISHRLSTIQDYDRLLVLDMGELVSYEKIDNLLDA